MVIQWKCVDKMKKLLFLIVLILIQGAVWAQNDVSEEMLAAAYDIAVDNLGKPKFSYINKIQYNHVFICSFFIFLFYLYIVSNDMICFFIN